jgi:hypothetical protein
MHALMQLVRKRIVFGIVVSHRRKEPPFDVLETKH